MNFTQSGVFVANAAVMSSPLYLAGSAAAGHPMADTQHAIPAFERRAAATVASVNRGTT